MKRSRAGMKRSRPDESTGPFPKKCYRPQASRSYSSHAFRGDDVMQDPESQNKSCGFPKEAIQNLSGKPGHSNTKSHKVHKARNSSNGSRQQQWTHKNQQQRNNKSRNANRGNARRGEDGKKVGQGKGPRFMTEEFKDMNALLVDGRLLCKHFLWGRCIKGDDCQLEHIQCYNDLIKEVCKFYIQGFCTKGESCPYMHKSFPCKFFHRKGKCYQGTGCKFSHEPLDDVTKRLLDEVVKRDNDLHELSKRAEQEQSEQPANTERPQSTEAKRDPDVLAQELRPCFYNSGRRIEGEPLLNPSDDVPDVPPRAAGGARPQSPPSADPEEEEEEEEPVCYSVEAVLGTPLFKPFPRLFTAPGGQGSAEQSEAPRSVDPLSSCTLVRTSTFGYTPAPTAAHDVSHPSKTDSDEPVDPLVKRQVHTDLISKTCPDLTQDHQRQDEEIPPAPKPAPRSSCEAKVESLHPSATEPDKSAPSKTRADLKGGTHLPVDITHLLSYKNALPFSATKGKTSTFTPRHPTPLRSHVSDPISNSQASVKPPCPSSGLPEFKGGGAQPVTGSAKTHDSGDSVGHQFAAKRPTEIHQQSTTARSGLTASTQQRNLTESTLEGSCKTAQMSDGGCRETQKRPFYSLFTSPIITDGLKPAPDSVTACPRGSTQPSLPPPPPAKDRNKTDRASAAAFLSLFAAPLPCTQFQPDHLNQSAHQRSHLSDSEHRASGSETPLTHRVKTNVKEAAHRPTSSKSPPCPQHFSEPECQAAEQQVNPACSLVSKSLSETLSSLAPADSSDPSSTQDPRQLSAISPPGGPAVGPAATTNSVLRTLFSCLSPYQQDGERRAVDQLSASPESERNKSGAECVAGEQQRKGKKKRRRKKKLKTQCFDQQSSEKTFLLSAPSPTSLISAEATVGSTLSSPALSESPARKSGHNLPFGPGKQQMQHHIQPSSKNPPEERKQVNGNVAVTPLKDLFKTLDTTVFHLGH